MVRQVNTLGTNAINIAVSPVSLEDERQKLRERLARRAEEERPAAPPVRRDNARGGAGATTRYCANDQCRNYNPSAARFCRRCGKVLA